MARLSHLRGVALGAPGLTEQAGFFADSWGLTEVAREGGAVYFRGTGPEHHILAIHDRPVRGIVRVEFGAARADLPALLAQAQAAGAKVLTPLGDFTSPGGGHGFEVIDPEGRVLRVAADVAGHADAGDAADRPRKVTHVVLNTTDLDAICQWYEKTIGMVVSDWSEHQMVFLRCSSDHHSIALNQGAHPSVNHIAFEMPSIDAQMRGIGRMKAAGYSVGWGVGRHGPGNNTFSYFRGPADFVIEYTAEVQQIDEQTHVPQIWPRVPHLMDRWGTAGPPPPEVRAAMAGTPDPGVGAR